MKRELIIYFTEENKSGYKCRESWLKKNNQSLYKNIIDYNIKCNFNPEIKFIQKIYNYIYDFVENPKCPTCNNLLKFKKNLKDGYQKYCSSKCTLTSDQVKKTNLEKYGVEYPLQSEEIQKKIKFGIEKKYGVNNPFQLKHVKEKIKKTNLEKYGVENPFQSEQIKKKIKETTILKYGVDNYSKTIECKKFKNKKYFNLYKKKYSKILNINKKNINFISNNYLIIKNYCDKHPNGFEITKSLLYDRIRLNLSICTKCYPINEQSSIKEKELLTFIKSFNINYIIENNRTVLNNKELDIYIPDHKLVIEFNGLYYHSELYKPKNYHLNKTIECQKKGIKLIHIFEDEWMYKPDIVKSIIRNKLGLINNRIYARKCIIKEIDNKLCRNFLNNNHIQGNVNSKIKLGLFYDNELVSIMTFNKARKSISNDINNSYELNRFCNKINHSIIGGVSKLLKYFIRNYNPKQIISYADRRYSNGNLYKTLGFERVHDTKPNYQYFKNNELARYHRFNFRKDKLIKDGYDRNKTEHEIMIERGYYRIYDCGNIKYIMNL